MIYSIHANTGSIFVERKQNSILVSTAELGEKPSSHAVLTEHQAKEFLDWLRRSASEGRRFFVHGFWDRTLDAEVLNQNLRIAIQGTSVELPMLEIQSLANFVASAVEDTDARTLILGTGRVYLFESEKYSDAIEYVRQNRPEENHDWIEVWRGGRLAAVLREE